MNNKVKPYDFIDFNDGNSVSNKPSVSQEFRGFANQSASIEKEITYSQDQLTVAKQESYDKGLAEGITQGKGQSFELEQQISAMLGGITPQMVSLFSEYKLKSAAQAADLVELSVVIAQKIAGEAITENPTKLIEDVVKQCMVFLFKEPRVNITVHQTLRDAVEEKITQATKDAPFDGDVKITGCQNIPVGDCRVEWSDGGAELDITQKIMQINEALGVKPDQENINNVQDDIPDVVADQQLTQGDEDGN